MPSHKIHLAISNEVNKILKLDNDSIMLGSVMPDLSIMKEQYHIIKLKEVMKKN